MSYLPRYYVMTTGPRSPEEALVMSARGRTTCRWALALVIVGAFLAAFGNEVVSRAQAAKNIPPIAEPMYLSAYASVITGRAGDAVRPLRHLAVVDPTLADVQNALALAIFTATPDKHQRAFAHAGRAVELAPDVPQFVVTYVLTDRRNWLIEADGTARLTRGAALMLRAAATVLMTTGERGSDFGRLLATTEAPRANPDFPYTLPGYAALVANPRLAFTRPNGASFATAQKAIVRNVADKRAQRVAQASDHLIIVEPSRAAPVITVEVAAPTRLPRTSEDK